MLLSVGLGVAVRLLTGPETTSDTAPETPTPPAASSSPAPKPATAERSTAEPPVRTKPSVPAKAPVAAAPVTPAEPAVPTTGTLRIMADVADASVFIDRKFIGTAPVTANDIAPGAHRLNVSAPGYDAVAEEIDVVAGPRDIEVKLKEIRLSASIQVTHKHGMGSCSGTLKATPQGVTYETANAGDAFTVPLPSIETFDVDYINKNLKLKVKNGKTYNFTDSEGNADRLFAFHRDVDKVRKRMLAGDAAR
jgi:hypothetical protein